MTAPRMCLILSENWTMTSGRDLPTLVRWAREAEDAGFDSVMISEHVVLGPSAGANGVMLNPREYALPGNQDPATPWPSSLVLLSAIAAVTTRVRLVAGAVIAPLRHPLLIARELGSLDLLSGGRLVVQPTVSWLEEEYAALGVPFRSRGDLLDEHLGAWAVLWRDSPATYSGTHYRFRDVYFEPKAFRPEGPALWLGGTGLHRRMTERIVAYGSGFNPLGRPAPQEMARLAEAMTAAGRDMRELELVGGTRAVFPDPGGVADLGRALEAIPPQAAAGFTTFCIKPSQFTDDPRDVGRLCREIIRRVDKIILSNARCSPGLAGWHAGYVATHVVSPVLVGRADQLSALEAALAEARHGQPAAVLVGGEAGIGKSRLVSEFAERARRDGGRVLTGGCLELGADGLPFAPFSSVLRELVRDLGADGVAGLLPGGSARELARLLPEFGEPAESVDAGTARARLFEQVLILLERLAERGPLVLLIEDAHWADQSTRELLAFLIRNQHALDGLLIVVTYRSDELHRTHPLRTLLAELGRIGWVARLELDRLSRRDTDDLVARLTDTQPSDEVLEDVYRRTEGNPLFVEALIDDRALGSGLPESLRDLLVAGVRRLPEHTQEAVRVASAGGERTGHALLAAVTGLDDSALANALRPAVSANVLLTDADGYVFRHNLIREAVHEELLPGERSQLHARFAEVINGDPALVPPGRAAVEQAYHWYAAHDAAGALVSAWHAATESGKALAYAEQLTMLSRVLELWDQVPGAAERIDADHTAVLEAALAAAELAGEFERGITFGQAALREVDVAAEPVRAALVYLALGRLKSQVGRADFGDDLDEAVRLVPADPPSSARARVLAAIASERNHRYGVSDPGEAQAFAEEALAVARQVGDVATEAVALENLACSAPVTTNLERIQALLGEVREAATRAGAYKSLLHASITESDVLEGIGEHEQAAAVAREGIADAGVQGLARTSGAILAINLAEPLVSLGRWDEASDVIERALQTVPVPLRRSSLWRLAGDVALARGDLAAAAEAAASIRAVVEGVAFKDERQPPFARLEADLRLAQRRPGEALSTVESALDRWSVLTSGRYAWPLMVAGARACAAAGAARDEPLSTHAALLRDRLRTEAGKLDAEGALQQAHQLTFAAEMMRADRVLAGAPAGEGPADAPEPGDLRDAWDAAAGAWDALREPYPLATALFRSAEAALSDGDHDGGAERLRRAASLAERLGAAPLTAEIALLARRARIGLDADAGQDGPRAVREPERLGLTAREFDVLRLVAAGRSNAEIAAELFISAKTASVHVSNILGKLSVASRGEAAATAHRLRLFDSFPE